MSELIEDLMMLADKCSEDNPADELGLLLVRAVGQIRGDASALSAKDARIAELEEHCKRLGAGDAERYWEGRWRDADAEISRLRDRTTESLDSQQQAEPEDPCPVCGNEVRGQGGYLSCECPAPKPATPSEDGGEVPQYFRQPLGIDEKARGRLTLIAREAAISSTHRYRYMPTTPEDAQSWQPHAWVLEAMRRVELEHSRIVAAKDAEIARLKADDAEAIKRPPYAHICIGMPAALHHDTCKLLERFTHALAVKLRAAEEKYGYSNGWKDAGWMDECRAKLAEHMAKGDPRDVAAYCAFLWHHGESTAQPARQVGGDEQERFRAWILSKWPNTTFQVTLDTGRYVGWLEDAWLGWQARAALAPAAVAVVLPTVDQVMKVVMRYQWEDKANVTGTTNWAANLGMAVVNEVARLNRRAIPVGLLEQVCEALEEEVNARYAGTQDHPALIAKYERDMSDVRELRALLGKEGE